MSIYKSVLFDERLRNFPSADETKIAHLDLLRRGDVAIQTSIRHFLKLINL